MSELRVGLIDADDSVRMGRSLLLNSQPNIDIVLESADPVASLDSLPDYLIDVLVIDARVPGMTIAEYLTKLNAALLDSGNQMRVIVSCTFGSPELELAVLEAGASALCPQDSGVASLLSNLRSLSIAPRVLTRDALKSLLENAPVQAPNPTLVAALKLLDASQHRVLEALLDGLTDTQIAKQLELTKYRVTKFLDSLCLNLGYVSRVQLELALLRASF